MKIFNNNTGIAPYVYIIPETNTLSISTLKDRDSNLHEEMYELMQDNDLYYLLSCYKLDDTIIPESIFSEDLIDKFRNGSIKLLVDNLNESIYTTIEYIYKELVIRLNIPESHIVYLSMGYDAPDYINFTANIMQRKPIRCTYINQIEVYCKNLYGRDTPTLEHKKYDKKFILLNHIGRPHRLILFFLLHHYDLLKHGHVSMHQYSDGFYYAGLSKINNLDLKEKIQNSHKLKDSLIPMVLDEGAVKNNVWQFPVHDKTDSEIYNFFKDTYFSIVTEVYFFMELDESSYRYENFNNRLISEKTYKNILKKHPFVMVNAPKSLELLKTLGFKTFSPWINEDYDNEFDDTKRMIMIINEIMRLCNLNADELTDFINNCKEICEYNYNVMKSRALNDYIVDKII